MKKYVEPLTDPNDVSEVNGIFFIIIGVLLALEEDEDFTMNKHIFKLANIPGHQHLRCRCSNQFKSARGLAYAIDSITCRKDVRDTAEYLYNVHIM